MRYLLEQRDTITAFAVKIRLMIPEPALSNSPISDFGISGGYASSPDGRGARARMTPSVRRIEIVSEPRGIAKAQSLTM